MQQELLPLFPLELVLLPGALQDKSEFGIVLAIEKGIVNTGCTAVVERVVKQMTMAGWTSLPAAGGVSKSCY